MTWKAALPAATKGRGRRDFFRAVFVATPAAIIGSISHGVSRGLLLAGEIAAAVFLIDIVDDARKSRRRARREASRVSG